jgi:hypothetical protein
VLPDDTLLHLKSGEKIQILMAGKTFKIVGPYRGPAKDYKPCSGVSSFAGLCSKAEDDGLEIGATRSLRKKAN